MKYMLLFCSEAGAMEYGSEAERNRVYEEIGTWWARNYQAGTIVSGEELQPVSTATTVRFQGDGTLVSDGPFIESKEAVGGYALIEVSDLDAAIGLAKTWPAPGAVEIRPVVQRDEHD
jgi:hypothetical protein